MSAGQPLNDQDRAPWLATLHEQIATWISEKRNAVLACSALKETYRDVLAGDHHEVRFVYLYGAKSLLMERLTRRSNHYMPPTLLDSQLSTLEPPADALKLDVIATPEELVRQIRGAFQV
jgi:gluconokinase